MTAESVRMCLVVACGFALGVLLNLCADRLPQGAAQRQRGWRFFAADRPRLARWVALLALCMWLAVHLHRRYGWSLAVPIHAAYGSLLLLIAAIDLEHHVVPNTLVLVGLGLALVGSTLSFSAAAIPGIRAALAGAATGGGLFLVLALARRNALGLGDVKLAFLIGMMTGFPWVLQALVLGILLGGLAAGLLLLLRLRGPKQYMPYAPYLVAGALITLLYGQDVACWYARLAGVGG